MRYLISLMLLILISMTGCRYAEVPRADKDHPAIASPAP
jgi:hypothetical protein